MLRYPEAFFIDDDEVSDETPTPKLQFTPYNQKNDSPSKSGIYTAQIDNQSAGSYEAYTYKFEDDYDEEFKEEADATSSLHEDAYAQVLGESDDENTEIKAAIPNSTVDLGYANDKPNTSNNSNVYYTSSSASLGEYYSEKQSTNEGFYSSDSYISDGNESDKSASTVPKFTHASRNYNKNVPNTNFQMDFESDLIQKSNSSNSMMSKHKYNLHFFYFNPINASRSN